MTLSTKNQDSNQNKPIQRGIYLLPNLLTSVALFAGFYSIIAAFDHRFDTAAIAIFAAWVADGLDGRVARLTNTQTAFGAQYDSMSDLVCFGVAPALILYSWSFFTMGKLGWFAAFLYVAAVALRLARFNTQVTDKRYFQGIPCPAAAGLTTSAIWLTYTCGGSGPVIAVPLLVLGVLVAALMVSRVRYSSFKSVDFRGKVPFLTVVLVVLVLAGIALEPPVVLFALFFIYMLSGPILTIFTKWQLRKMRRNGHK